MTSGELQRRMYELQGATMAQRLTLAGLTGAWVAAGWWMLFGGGIAVAGGWIGTGWKPGDETRRLVLASGFSMYYLRILITEFVFLKRGVSWSEVFTVAPWLLCIFLLLSIAGGTNAAPFGPAAWAGVCLFLAGSWMNTYSEYARHIWKRRPENRGRLYTRGLFRYSRHPNYLGDMLSFSGLCLISGNWLTSVVPALMLAGFVFVNIPVLDSHLQARYGSAFDEYARRTRKLVPFVY